MNEQELKEYFERLAETRQHIQKAYGRYVEFGFALQIQAAIAKGNR